jgi:hypothetical protein
MLGCILPSGNAAEFQKLDAEMQRRGINPLFRTHDTGARTYIILERDIPKLPSDERGPYFGNDESGHSIYPVDDILALYRPLFLPRVDISKRETRFLMEDGSTVILRGIHEGDHDQVYTSAQAGSFNATVALQWARENMPIVPVTLDVMHNLHGMHKNIDLDTTRLMEIAERPFDDVLKETVLLYILFDDGQPLLIDGHHRLAFLLMCCGRSNVEILQSRAYMIPHDLAEQFKVTYAERWPDGRERAITAEELLVRISGIYTSPGGGIRDTRARS